MDLSKLWFEKEISPNSVNAMEIIRKHHKNKNVEVVNLKVVSMPSYCYKFDIYDYNRSFKTKKLAYKGQTNIPNQTEDFTPASFTFDDFPIPEISFSDDFDRDFIIEKTQSLTTCPECGGNGESLCEACGGKGKTSCPKCRGMGFRKCSSCQGTGWRRCRKCYGKKGEYIWNGNYKSWRPCTECYEKGEVRCIDCGNKGEIPCKRCNGTGIAVCQQCGGEGRKKCALCEGAGKIVKCIVMSDVNLINEDFEIQHHPAISKNLKRFLEGNENNYIGETVERILSFENPIPVIESIDTPADLLEIFNSDVYLPSKYISRDSIFNYRIDFCNDYDSEQRDTRKILKVRTRIFQINVIHISYKCGGKDCELWLYGKDNTLFEEKDLKRLLAEEKEQEEREKAQAEKKRKRQQLSSMRILMMMTQKTIQRI